MQAVETLDAKLPTTPSQQGIPRQGANVTKGRVIAEKETESEEHRDGCVIELHWGARKQQVIDSCGDTEGGSYCEVVDRTESETIVG
jgi:hypothetical protein